MKTLAVILMLMLPGLTHADRVADTSLVIPVELKDATHVQEEDEDRPEFCNAYQDRLFRYSLHAHYKDGTKDSQYFGRYKEVEAEWDRINCPGSFHAETL